MVCMGHRRKLCVFHKEAMMATGTVKFFNSQKGFGFIVQDGGGPDVFAEADEMARAAHKRGPFAQV